MRTLQFLTRRSHLALVQAMMPIIPLLAIKPNETQSGFAIAIVPTDTTGDRGKSSEFRPIVQVQAPSNAKADWFAEIDEAVAAGIGDIGVHSAKDIPPEIHPATCLFPILERGDPRDVFVSRDGRKLRDLPQGAVIGTNSTRRRSQLARIRPDLQFVAYSGNVMTRISSETMDSRKVDGILLALTGIQRLGALIPAEIFGRLDILDLDEMTPCVNQAIVAVQCRRDDEQVCDLVRERLVFTATNTVWRAERAVLEAMNADCKKPLAIHATSDSTQVSLVAKAFSPDGTRLLERRLSCGEGEVEGAGRDLGHALKADIAQERIWT